MERLSDGAGKVVTTLHPGQMAVMNSDARFVAMCAGTQSGKTSLGPLWMEREIRRRGPGDYLCVTATFPLLMRKMLPEFVRYFEGTMNLGWYSKGDRCFYFRDTDTRIMFGSAMHPESLESATAKAAWLDECGQQQFRLESWEAIQRRVAIYRGRVLMTSTPYNLGWWKTEVYDKAKMGDADFCVIQFASTMNPSFPSEELERVKGSGIPAWKYRMFYLGEFDNPPGLIYSTYVDAYKEFGGHLVRQFPISPDWPRFVGIDFGGSNCAKIYVAQDPITNVFYIYHETLTGHRTAKQHVEDILDTLGGAPLFGVWGGAKSEESWRLEFAQAGLPINDPDTYDLEVGIDRAVGMFTNNRVLVFDSCRGFRDELGTYSRPVAPDGTVLDGIVDKHVYHRLDAWRYVGSGLSGYGLALPILAMGSTKGWQPRALR